MTFTQAEREYLTSQPLGRLATVSAEGDAQNNPVSVDPSTVRGVHPGAAAG